MKGKRIASFEELMDRRYGTASPQPRRFAADFETLVSGYYGLPATKPAKARAVTRVVAMTSDDGRKLLKQRRRPLERVEVQSLAPTAAIGQRPAPEQPVMADEERARQEQLLDLCAQPPMAAPPDPPLKSDAPPLQPKGSGDAGLKAPAAPPTGAPKPASEDEFLADMKAILSGQKAYDPTSKTLTDRHAIAQPAEARDDPPPKPPSQPRPRPQAGGDDHDIFDRIAQSMEYADAYELGPVELENRFAQFDAAAEGRRATAAKPAAHSPFAPPQSPAVGSGLEGMRKDLEDILARPGPPPPKPPLPEEFFPDIGGPAAPPLPAVPMSAAEPDYAQPLYASGEHYRAGDGLYPNALVVGQKPGLAFSYGHIIAMADLFETPDQMMNASVDELAKIKGLLNADIAHYAPGGRANPAPGSEQWEWATKGRYLRLAEDNYEHFAPNILFRDAKFISSVSRHGDHKNAWEKYHLRALREVAALKPGLDPDLTHNQSPLIVNAFGDHFLTDAFSSGHVINKAAVMDLFKANFYSGGKLSKAGEQFLETVAKLAFKGKLAEKFSVLETYDPKLLWWNPNIDSPGMFAKLLIGIANAEPDKVANLAVKALHDKLNEEGIEVTNGLGAAPWRLTGDGHLTEATLLVMQAAVKQSVANILDPAARQPGFAPAPFLARVWAHVPQLTQKSLDYLRAQVPSFINTNSVWLSGASAEILHNEVDTLISELLQRKILKPA